MSKNISVKVGGVSRNFSNVPKIQIKEALTGNNIDWIPEDEANDYAETETLRVNENGTYHPSSGKCGFDEVIVRVPGGGGGTLIEKNISENGEYYAMDDNADGYSKVAVNVAGASNIMTSEEWAALTYEEKVAAGLTIVRNNDGDIQGLWYNYAYDIPLDFVAEYYAFTESKSFVVSPEYSHYVVWQGRWATEPGRRYSNARVMANDITWGDVEGGSVGILYHQDTISEYQTTILSQITYGEAPTFTIADALASRQGSYGVVIGVRPLSNFTILAEYYDTLSHTYTLLEDYDAVIVLGAKSGLGGDSINVLTGDFSTGKAGEEFSQYSAQVPMAQIFGNVKKDTTITTYAMPNTAEMGAVIIGVNYI